MNKHQWIVLGVTAAATATMMIVPSSAKADSETCMARVEFDALESGMTRNRVYEIADIYGRYIGDSVDGGEYRVAYRICWNEDRRAVLGFSYDTNRLEWWDIRDRPGV